LPSLSRLRLTWVNGLLAISWPWIYTKK
jgi:hypothetical protein